MKVQKNRKQKAGSVERIHNAVLAKYHGQKDICVANAIKRWKEDCLAAFDVEPLGVLFHKIECPEMEKLAIEWHIADIEENVAIEKVKQLHVKVGEAGSKFISGLAVNEGVYANTDDMNVVISRMEIWKVDKDSLKKSMPRKVIEFSKAVACDELDVRAIREGKFPAKFKELRIIEDFVKDLLDYIAESGDHGKTLVKRICADRTCAQHLLTDRTLAPPVKHLAEQVIATQAPEAPLDDNHTRVGFNAA